VERGELAEGVACLVAAVSAGQITACGWFLGSSFALAVLLLIAVSQEVSLAGQAVDFASQVTAEKAEQFGLWFWVDFGVIFGFALAVVGLCVASSAVQAAASDAVYPACDIATDKADQVTIGNGYKASNEDEDLHSCK